jgi:hypothetical protein
MCKELLNCIVGVVSCGIQGRLSKVAVCHRDCRYALAEGRSIQVIQLLAPGAKKELPRLLDDAN